MAEQLGKFLTELPELTSPSDSNLMYVVDGDTSKKATLGNLKKIVGGDVTGIESGAIVSFSDGADNIPLKSFIAQINPTQDLHGYDKPWAGGAGKNKFNYSAGTQNIAANGITFTVNSDGTVTATGTATGTAQVYLVFPSATYGSVWSGLVLNGCPSIRGCSIRIERQTSPWTNFATDTGSGATIKSIPADVGNVVVYCRIAQGTTVNNAVFKPMMRLPSVTDASFEPYSNICPISGHSSVTVTVSDGETSTTKTTPLGQTVYGGQLNVLTGELTVDKAIVTYDGSENWANQTTYRFYLPSLPDNLTTDYAKKYNSISNIFIYRDSGDTYGNGFAFDGTGLWVNKETSSDTLANFKNYLGQHNLQICYPLATPQTVQLTPTEVKSLLGQNYISANTGNSEVIYVRDLNIVINDLINRVTALENE